MNSRVNSYKFAFSGCAYDIIALTETWLNDRTTSHQLFGPDYEVLRCDRGPLNSRKATGGGVLLAVRRGFTVLKRQNQSWSNVEQIWATVKLTDRNLHNCVVYFPPDRTRDTAVINAHNRSVAYVAADADHSDETLVVGDFNLPGLKWCSSNSGFRYPDPAVSTFHTGAMNILDCYNSAKLRQINEVLNENGRMLDLCFVSIGTKIRATSAPVPLVNSVPHHPPLHLVLNGNPTTVNMNTVSDVVYNFRRADFASMLGVLYSLDWDDILDNNDVNAATLTLTHVLGYIIDRHVPKKVIIASTTTPWQTAELRRLQRVKRAALRRFSKHRSLALRDYLVRLNLDYKKLSMRCFNAHQHRMQRKLKTNPKAFWSFVNEQRKDPGSPSTMFYNGEVETDSNGLCRLFSENSAVLS
ncbi:uncharacterized protein LOC129728926 [Wyeomyia smithii]|uniref:uncharacterized protein LOC129728926 n=1 Tax=Wyeomyia smithii TaxID=174621 RepID=UPI002467DB93|nr:uncharacterized protein LOC129728926 [Wyeomyia smithii]